MKEQLLKILKKFKYRDDLRRICDARDAKSECIDVECPDCPFFHNENLQKLIDELEKETEK